MEDDVVTVRGRLINISSNVINELYGVGADEELESLNYQITSDELAAAICNTPDPEWSKRSMKALKSTSLSREAKVWLLFINATVMPTRHLNNVTLDRAELIYHILKGDRINVGAIISNHLKMKIREDKAKLLWFPTLITELCRQAGVVCGTEDLITQVRRPITGQVVEVNIKVGTEMDSVSKTPHKRIGSRPSTSWAGKRENVAVPSGEGVTLHEAMDSIEYIKVYLRCQHCYFSSRLDIMFNCLVNDYSALLT
ncbi:hypothetical protein KSP40_PGU011515 [Platanthera guangdongensis]|uniref:Putative plant transposon protein domain-containing protein n=1 Tax=Platanthera guangdongensis TaxID=2320717 RepID=A0ABR2MIQ2_9ASPA